MGKYLLECFNSIYSQTLENIELIVVDDGSNDNTNQIVNEYNEKYGNIIYKKTNHIGSGLARNKGIELANGEYLAFMDADDFYPNNNVLSTLYSNANNKKANVCGGKWLELSNGKLSTNSFANDPILTDDGWYSFDEIIRIAGYLRFIYKKSFLIEFKIFFPKYLRHQDPPFFIKALFYAKKIYFINFYSYVYRRNHKEFVYSDEIILDFLHAENEMLVLLNRFKMKKAFTYYVDNTVHGEYAGVAYKCYSNGNYKINSIIHEINERIIEGNSSNLLLENDDIDAFVSEAIIEKEAIIWQYGKNSAKPFLIFGAGKNAKKIIEFLKKESIIPEALIVTAKKSNPDFLDGIPIKPVSSYDDKSEKYDVIVSVSLFYVKEVREYLKAFHFNKIYYVDMEKFFVMQEVCYH